MSYQPSSTTTSGYRYITTQRAYQSNTNSIEQLQKKIKSLQKTLQQKNALIKQYEKRLQEQQRVIEEKQFNLREKILQLEYIHKQNEELHDKLYNFNKKNNQEQHQLKKTIKEEVSILKDEFNFLIKESQIKSQIILDQKTKQFNQKQSELKEIIRELSEKASSNNSFAYDQTVSNSNQSKSKNGASSFANYHRSDIFHQNQQDRNSVNLRNSRDSYNSLSSDILQHRRQLRQSKVGLQPQSARKLNQAKQRTILQFNNKTQNSDVNSVETGRFGTNNLSRVSNTSKILFQRQTRQVRPEFRKAQSKSNIDQIINRSKKQMEERTKKLSDSKVGISSCNSIHKNNATYKYKATTNLNQSRLSSKLTNDSGDDKRKAQKLKQINSLKMKVNLLKSELQEQISFCHKD